MSHSDQFPQNGSTSIAQVEHVADVERLIPQNLSNNKRAIIDRLVALYKHEAKSKRFPDSHQQQSA